MWRSEAVEIRVVNHYWLTGSFIHGTGEGHAEAPDIDVRVQQRRSDRDDAGAGRRRDGRLARHRIRARAARRQHLCALHQWSPPARSRASPTLPPANAGDPYRVYARAPRPIDVKRASRSDREDRSSRAGRDRAGLGDGHQQAHPQISSARVTSLGRDGMYAVDTWLGMPGTSHFRLMSDESGAGAAPSGLALLSAGIAFCYMTQLSRYIENMKMKIHGVRLVQFNPLSGGSDGCGRADRYASLSQRRGAPKTRIGSCSPSRRAPATCMRRRGRRPSRICASSTTGRMSPARRRPASGRPGGEAAR